MFCYNEDNSDVIISCTFDGINIADLDPNEIMCEGSTWADHKLLYKITKAYTALTGWKPTLESLTWIKCSCFSRTKCNNRSPREYSNGSLCKDCKWQIKIKSTKNINRKIISVSLEGKYKSIPF